MDVCGGPMLRLLCCSMEIKFEMAMNRYWH